MEMLTSRVKTCRICVLILCVSSVVPQNILHRSYDLNPTADTFINNDRDKNYQKEYFQLGRNSASFQSRILMRFDVEGFKRTSEWDASGSSNLNKTTILSAKLRLTCISGSLNSTVSTSRIVRSWNEDVVTSTTRGQNGELWSMSFLNTRGEDATAAIEKNYLFVNADKAGQRFVFEIEMKEIFKHWLDNTASSHGLLLWIENTTSSEVVKFASTDYGLISLHPVLKVVLEDEVFIKGNCTSNEIQCGDGSCVTEDKRCNFVNDCLHGTDEDTCGIDCGFETLCGWDSAVSEGAIGWGIGSAVLKQDSYLFVNGSQEPSGTVSELSQEFRDSDHRCTLHFNYLMSGGDGNLLDMAVVYDGAQHTVWTKNGRDNEDNFWQGDVLNIGRLEGAFRVFFRARTGGTAPGIIALDNISLKDCGPDSGSSVEPCGSSQLTCSNLQCVSPNRVCDFNKDCLFGEDEDSSVCGAMPAGSRCNFEDGLCGWWDIVAEDHFNWTRHHGITPTSNTGPDVDHTLGTTSGYYIYTEVSGSSLSRGSEAYIRSPWFRPPPPEVGNQTSPFYRMCQIRFYHHMYGKHNAQLKLYVYHNDTRGTTNRLFSETTSRTEVPWTLYEVPLEFTTVSYYLQFEAAKGTSYSGDVALDDISLSRECFTLEHLKQTTTTVEPSSVAMTTDTITIGSTYVSSTNAETSPTQKQTFPGTNSTKFEFNTCGVKGREGPTQAQCDIAYRHSNVSVRVEESGDEFIAGVQMWVVPVSRLYRIIVKGASGGRGIESSQDSFGAVVMATFNLTRGDVLYIIVGQEGESACDEDHKLIGNQCDGLDDDVRAEYGPGGRHAGGGGGGGGASYVAMYNKTSSEWYPLLVAGGGGGLALSDQMSQYGKNGGIVDDGPGFNGLMNTNDRDTSGSGGGWSDNTSSLTSGRSFLQGAVGGKTCSAGFEDNLWSTSGGFGGGGGPCVSGGGGGGYTGGKASLTKDIEAYGFGGTSYISPDAMLVHKEMANHVTDGAVQVFATVSCDLAEKLSPDFAECLGSNPTTVIPATERQSIKVKLILYLGTVHFCIIVILVLVSAFCCSPTTFYPPADNTSSINYVTIIAASIAVLIPLSILLLLILCFYRRQSKKLKTIEEQIPAVQLAQLRENITVDVNPCYQFGDGTVTSSDLKELPRSQIKLVRALGEGAFGEVFEGTYKVSTFEMRPIAVKTLPEVSTEQNEVDFLLEAIIMKNFSHKNIVTFIGVCFTQHPRFIVLELMAGGELKQFLRDNRPIKDQPSKIQMVDLLHVAQDVARGCCYLESQKFIHRDIAARNILLTSRSADRVAKIGDFGMARDIYGADYYRKSGRALLPVKWMPPEAFLDGIFTAKTDIWSFGVLLWEIMSLGYMPYPGMSNQEVIHFVSTGNRMSPPSKCPPPIYSLIEECWSEKPEERPSSCLLLERIGYCLQDPDVLNSPLPVSIPQLNRQLTVNRPPDLDNSPTLTVERSEHLSNDLQSPTDNNLPTIQTHPSIDDDESRDEVFTRQNSLRQYQFQFPQDPTYQYTPSMDPKQYMPSMDAKQKQSLFYNRVYQYSTSLGEDDVNPLSQSYPRSYRRSVSTPEENVRDPLSCSLNIPSRNSCDEDSSLGTNPFLPLVKKSSNPFTKPIKEHRSLDETSGLLEYANESTTSSNVSSVQGSSRSLDNSNLYSENTDGSEQSGDGSVKLRERPRSRPGSRRGSAPRTNVRCSKTLSDVEIGAMCDPSKLAQTFSGNIGTNPRLSRNVDGCATFPRSSSRSSESDETLSNCSRKRSLKRQRNHEADVALPSNTSEIDIPDKPLMSPVSPGRALKQDQTTGMFLFGEEENATVV